MSDVLHGVPSHLSDEALLLLIDGELQAGERETAHRHLDLCAECSTRMARLQQLSADLVVTHAVDARNGRAAKACAAVVTALCCLYWLAANGAPHEEPTVASLQMGALPVTYLTPGATRSVTSTELCRQTRADDAENISPSVKHVVLRNYGVRGLPDRDYELDYLITPELGGSADPQNLWPERYASTTWNAHVKDDLEHLLRRMVCDGSVPLLSAQQAIATNWIDTYKRYFHTTKPGGWTATLPQPVPQRE